MKANLSELSTSEAMLILLDIGLKFTLLLAGLLFAVALMRHILNVSAAKRASLLWTGAIAIPVITASSFVGEKQPLTIVEPKAPMVQVVADTPTETMDTAARKPLIRKVIDPAVTALNTPSADPVSPAPVIEANPAPPTRSHIWLLGVWIVGIGLVTMHLGIGIVMLNRRARFFTRATNSNPLFETLATTARELGLRKTPQLLLASEGSTMPMTWGAFRHRVVLPAAASSWSPERLRLVLQHELNHIKRRDCLASWAMRLLLAPAWFHPLAWLLARQATDLRERACDDAVSKMNENIDRYAHELVALSRGSRGLAGAVAMARPQRLRARIVALYCPRIGRSGATGIFRGSAAALLALCVLPMCLFCACQTTDVSSGTGAPSKSKPAHAPSEAKLEITPQPVFKKGDKKVMLQATELTLEGKLGFGEAAILAHATKGKTMTIPVADMIDMSNQKGANTFTITPFPTGRTHKFKIARDFTYPINPEADAADHKMTSREVGVMGDALVTPLPDGKLSVVVNFQVVEFDGFKADAAGVQRPEFTVRKINSEQVTIENGGGLSPFLVQTENKIPLLADIPLLGKLFRSKSENRFQRMLMIRVLVSDP